MAKDKPPPTLESLQSEVDELEWELGELKEKVSDLESELKELKELIPDDLKDDIKDMLSRIDELERRD